MADEIIQRSMPAVPGVETAPVLGVPTGATLRARCNCYGILPATDSFFFWRQDGRAEPNATGWVPVREIADGT